MSNWLPQFHLLINEEIVLDMATSYELVWELFVRVTVPCCLSFSSVIFLFPLLGTPKSVRGASVGRLQFVSTGLSAHEGRPRETPFKNLALMVKPHFSETQDGRECHRVNCKMLSELFNLDE